MNVATLSQAATGSAVAQTKRKNDKGSIGNRIEYAGKQTAHIYKANLKDSFVSAGGLAVTAAATAGVAKSKSAQKLVTSGLTALKNNKLVKETAGAFKKIATEAAPYLEKGLDVIIDLPKPARAVLLGGTVLTCAVRGLVRTKSIYDAGKIDQQYTDKAKMQEILK